MIIRIFPLVALLIFIPLSAEGKALYVNNSGSPACSDSTTYANNSSSNPWCSLIRATWGRTDRNRSASSVPSEAAKAGDTVYVMAGTYHYAGSFTGGGWLEPLYDPANAGSAGNWITFEAVGTVHLTGNTSGWSSTFGSSKSYVRWKGFTVNEANSAWRNAMVTVNTSHVSLENNTIIGQYRSLSSPDNHVGIMVHGPRDGDCTGGVNNITIKNNKVYGFTGNSGRNDTGITLYCLGSDITIENNEIYNNITGIYAKSSYQDTSNFNIRYNLFHSNAGDGIAMQAWYDWHVVQNIFRDNQNGFLWFCTEYYVGNPAPKDIYIVNNTFDGNTQAFTFRSLCENLNSNHARNNLITSSTHAFLSVSSICESTTHMGTDDINHNYSGYYGISGNFFAREGGSNVANWSTWRSSYGQDANSSNGINPLYVNPSGNDFRLQSGSPARTWGRTMTRIHGNDGQTIPAGAYITGNEVIGVTLVRPPVGLQIIPE